MILAQEWILKVETHKPSDLEIPGEGWVSLDRRLAAALTKIAHGEIGRQITQATTMALNNNTVARGSVLPANVSQYYVSGNNAQVLYDLNHLQKLTLRGDNLKSFLNTWNMVLGELSVPLDPNILQYLYFQQAQHFKPLAEGIAHYKRDKYPGSTD